MHRRSALERELQHPDSLFLILPTDSQAIQSHSAPNGGSRAKSKFHEQFEMMPTKAGKTTGVVHGASASGNHGGENFMPQSSFQRSNSVYPYRLDQMQGENGMS